MSQLNELLLKSASELAELIRQKKLTPTEVVEAHLTRLENLNPDLNAVAESRAVQARAEAEVWTQKIAAMDDTSGLPPFAGVPFTSKEMFAIPGHKQTAGSLHRRDYYPEHEATVVKRLRDAGAILIATTNVPELGFWFECENPLYGRTNNPYDLTRTSGGSSGGEGALLGAGASPMGLGSDIGGSIRMPAAFCGVYGHKPTRRRLPLTGHFPFSDEDIHSFTPEDYPATCSGFLVRRARDLSPVYKTLRGPDGIDLQIQEAPLQPSAKDFSLGDLTIYVCKDPQFHMAHRASAEIQSSVEQTARLLEQYGATVKEWNPRFFVRAVELWFAAIKAGKIQSFEELLSPEAPLELPKEFWSLVTGKARYTFPSLFTAFLEKTVSQSSEHSAKQEELRAEVEILRAEFQAKLGTQGVLLCPTHPRTAPKHRAPWLSPFDFIFTGVFNLFEGPALSCPVGLNEQGLPLAVQLVTAPDQDERLFQLAELIESSFGGWQI